MENNEISEVGPEDSGKARKSRKSKSEGKKSVLRKKSKKLQEDINLPTEEDHEDVKKEDLMKAPQGLSSLSESICYLNIILLKR